MHMVLVMILEMSFFLTHIICDFVCCFPFTLLEKELDVGLISTQVTLRVKSTLLKVRLGLTPSRLSFTSFFLLYLIKENKNENSLKGS